MEGLLEVRTFLIVGNVTNTSEVKEVVFFTTSYETFAPLLGFYSKRFQPVPWIMYAKENDDWISSCQERGSAP